MWFKKGIDPGTIIAPDQPVPSQWQIVKKLNEHNYQLDEHDVRCGFRLSYATTKLLCCDPNDHTKRGFMRIYLRVPFRGTEMDDADTRASQAMTIIPPELTAYEDLTKKKFKQYSEALGIPNLHAGYVRASPGKTGPDAFWALDASEREEIRRSFLEAFRKMEEIGYRNDGAGLSSLVWNQQSKTLYFIGFNLCNAAIFPRSNIPTVIDTKWVARYGLAIPNSKAWRKEEWNGDTSEWKW